MSISMYKASVPIFVQFLTALSVVLDKAAAHAEARKLDQGVLLNTRLYPDMFPLVRQVRAATDHAINACGRIAGAELPTFANTEASIPELKERIAKAIDFIKKQGENTAKKLKDEWDNSRKSLKKAVDQNAKNLGLPPP